MAEPTPARQHDPDTQDRSDNPEHSDRRGAQDVPEAAAVQHGQDGPAPTLVEGRDYALDEAGRYVFTAGYLRARGYCCFQGCRHCPWGQAGKPQAQVFAELQRRLDALEARLAGHGLSADLVGYSNGVLRVATPPALCLTDRPAAERLIRRCSEGLLTLAQIRWM